MSELQTDYTDAGGNGSVASDVLAGGRALQQVRTSYCTAVAVQKPRALAQVRHRLLEEARLAGEMFYYGWAAGKDRIEGPSVELAVAAARCWGNCATEMLPVQDLPDCWIFTAAFIDLETGYTRMRQFRQSKKWTVHGKLDAERKDDVRFQIGQSKAERNVILKAMPASLIRDAMDAAKSGVREKIDKFVAEKGMAAAQDVVVKGLARCGVKEAQILEKLGVAERKALTVDHLVILRGDLTAIDGGQERPEDLYPTAPAGTPPTGRQDLRTNGNGPKPPVETPPAEAASEAPSEQSAAPEPDADDLEQVRQQWDEHYRERLQAASSAADVTAVLTEISSAERAVVLGGALVRQIRDQVQKRLAELQRRPPAKGRISADDIR